MIRWIQITSGRGPDECCWVVSQVVKRILSEAKNLGFSINILETVSGDMPDTMKSALLALEGDDITAFTSQWEGTIQWIGSSPYRKKHRRKNWFVGVNILSPPEKNDFNEKDFKLEKMRSSGPGGQHVNKTESAIRITHLPTGLNAIAQEERSQHLNRKLAFARLVEKIKELENESAHQFRNKQWLLHSELERGNPVRIYRGPQFILNG